MLKGNRRAMGTKVGLGWQPDVAQFLLDMFPNALDYGLQLSDIAPFVRDEELFFDEASDDWYDDEDLFEDEDDPV